MTAEEQRELAREIDEAVRQGALAAGKLGSGMDRDMVELLQPQVDWREVLRDFVQTTCQGNDYSTWRRPNRRYIGAGIYMPSGISEQIGEIVVAIDTSGSIGARELGVFLAEIKEVADTVHPEAIRILYWDTKCVATSATKVPRWTTSCSLPSPRVAVAPTCAVCRSICKTNRSRRKQ
jgi:predicted metal-dependent peptidase